MFSVAEAEVRVSQCKGQGSVVLSVPAKPVSQSKEDPKPDAQPKSDGYRVEGCAPGPVVECRCLFMSPTIVFRSGLCVCVCVQPMFRCSYHIYMYMTVSFPL